MIAHTLNMCAPYILCIFDNILGIVKRRHYYIYTTIGLLGVICNSNFIFKLCIMIVNMLKMCTGDAGPEQSLVLFIKIFVLSIFSDRLHKFYCNQHSLPQRDDCKTRMTLNTARQSKDHTQKNTKNWTNNKQLTITN